MELQKIKFLQNATDFIDAQGGYSGSIKKYFKKGKNEYFLKIGKFKVRNDLDELLTQAEIPHPKVIESGNYDEENSYIIEETTKGVLLKEKLDEYAPKFIYEYGFIVGEKYRRLRRIFPDRPVNEETYNNIVKRVNLTLDELSINLEKYQKLLSASQIKFFDYIKGFLSTNHNLIKNSVMVYGHTDIKPSNFLLNGNEIWVIDFEHTDYKELSLSLIWCYARSDFKDEKNLAFARGYLDGLFNFSIPQGFLKCCNYTYLLNICETLNKSFRKENFEKIDNIIKYIQKKYLIKGKICLSKYLSGIKLLKNIPELKGFDITLVKGSYSPDNLTFKCTDGEHKYFLKLMKKNKKRHFEHCQNCYAVLENLKIPISPVRFYGRFKSLDTFYFVYDYIEFEEMDKHATLSFDEGNKLGKIVAKELIKLKAYKSNEFRTLDKNDLQTTLQDDVEFIYNNLEEKTLISFKKQEILNFINRLIKSFDKEPIALIHGDVKFGNILYNGKKIVFVDNESLMYSYDIMNFYYNILSGFRSSKVSLCQGFLNGYLKYMNKGKIPLRIQGQVKLLVLARFLRDVKGVINKTCSNKHIPLLNELCEQYIKNDEEITWLK